MGCAATDAADRGFDAGFRGAFGIFDRDVYWLPTVAVMDKSAEMNRSAIVDGLFEGIENEVGRAVRLTLQPTIIAGEDVDHQCDSDEACPSRYADH